MSFLWCQTMTSMTCVCTVRLFSTFKGGIARGCEQLKLCIVNCLYELWALWVLSIWFGVTVLCGSDFECCEFYDCEFLGYTAREIYGL